MNTESTNILKNGVAANVQPVKNRILILDALRGLALLGIAIANYPEFSLWTFLSEERQNSLSTAALDNVMKFFNYFLIDGKFYTIFSILFGIGFSIIIDNAKSKGANGFKIFYRRMSILLLIGFLHLMFLWSGDILMLYAVIGMILPFFRNCSNKTILKFAAAFYLLPIVIDIWRMYSNFNLADYLYNAWWTVAGAVGIYQDNFADWLKNAQNYGDVSKFLLQGSVERMWEFVVGQRYFKVLALFLTGYYIGRTKMIHNLSLNLTLISKIAKVGLLIGTPLSLVYAFCSVSGLIESGGVRSVIYIFSVYPLGIAYIASIICMYHKYSNLKIWKFLSYSGRMALTCYILQSVIGIILFYGIGFGLGTSVGLCLTWIIAILVFIFETIISSLWLKKFNFGPLEWIWRMLTYKKYFVLRKN